MKTIIVVLLAIFTLSTASANSMQPNKKKEKTLTFEVSMDCQGCVKKIEDHIPYEKGVKDLKVSLDEKTCEVTFREDKTSKEKLIKAFNKLGYEAKVKKTEKKKEGKE